MDPGPQKLMGPLSTLSCLGIWYQVIPNIQKCQKLAKATLTEPMIIHDPMGRIMCWNLPGVLQSNWQVGSLSPHPK
jgi:hypothetical protein